MADRHGKLREGVHKWGFPLADDLKAAAIAKAEAEGRPLAAVIREFLEEYIRTPPEPARP